VSRWDPGPPSSNGAERPEAEQRDVFVDRLTTAMVRRVATVQGTTLTAARDGVDVRLRHRARSRRRQRRGAAALATAVVALLLVSVWPDVARQPDVSSGPATTAAAPAVEAGITSREPADVALPQVTVDAEAGLSSPDGALPAAVTREAGDRVGDAPDELLVLRSPGNEIPVVYVVPRGRGELPVPAGAARTIAGVDGTVQGTAPGWVLLTWSTPAGDELRAWAYGVDEDTLTDLAGAVEVDGTGDAVAVAGALPDGFEASQVVLPEAAVSAEYTPVLASDDSAVTVIVDVLREPALLREHRLAATLAEAESTETTRFLGQDALLAHNRDGSWTVATTPHPDQPDLAVALRITGMTRPQLDALLPTFHLTPSN
jgi:hypothetical protein